eukprot:05670.XXX_190752_184305_1 [CDS] Oithona nana genome sequencing.
MAQRLLGHIPTDNSTTTTRPASVSLVSHRSSSSEDRLLRHLFSQAKTATATSGFRFRHRHFGSAPHYCNNLGSSKRRDPDYLSSSSLSICAYLQDNFRHPRLLIKVGLPHRHPIQKNTR